MWIHGIEGERDTAANNWTRRHLALVLIFMLVMTAGFAVAGCRSESSGSESSPYTVLGALKKMKPMPPSPPGNVGSTYSALDAALSLELTAAGAGATSGSISEYGQTGGILWTGSYKVQGDAITATVQLKAGRKTVTYTFNTLGNDGLRETDSKNNGRLWNRFPDEEED